MYVRCFNGLKFTLLFRFLEATLKSVQRDLKSEDPSRTTQPEYIHTIVSERTALLREKAHMRAKRSTGEVQRSEQGAEGEGQAQEGREDTDEKQEAGVFACLLCEYIL